MSNQHDVVLSGEASDELVVTISDVLKSRDVQMNVVYNGHTEDARAVPLGDFLVTAAAIAAILDFCLKYVPPILERLCRNKKELTEHAKTSGNERLREYNAHGFIVEAIELVEYEGRVQRVDRIILKNVPNQSFVEVRQETTLSFSVRQRYSRNNAEMEQ